MSLTEYNNLRREAQKKGVFEKGDSLDTLRKKLKKKTTGRESIRTSSRKRKRSTSGGKSSSQSSIFSGAKWVIR